MAAPPARVKNAPIAAIAVYDKICLKEKSLVMVVLHSGKGSRE